MNMSLGYNLNVGPVTITPLFYAFQLLNRQTATAIDQTFNAERHRSSRIRPARFYGQAGRRARRRPRQPARSTRRPAPCTDNPNYRKTTAQTGPRQFRFALKVTF